MWHKTWTIRAIFQNVLILWCKLCVCLWLQRQSKEFFNTQLIIDFSLQNTIQHNMVGFWFIFLFLYTFTCACLSLSFTRFEILIPLFKPFITQFDYSIAVITIFGMRLDIENAGYAAIWIPVSTYHNTYTGIQCALPIKAYELHIWQFYSHVEYSMSNINWSHKLLGHMIKTHRQRNIELEKSIVYSDVFCVCAYVPNSIVSLVH